MLLVMASGHAEAEGASEQVAVAEARPGVRTVRKFDSSEAAHAAGVVGALLSQADGINVTTRDFEVSQAICRALADLDPLGDGVHSRTLFAFLGERFRSSELSRRLDIMIAAGTVRTRGKRYDDLVWLSPRGAVGLLVTPLLTGVPGQRMLIELLSRAHARVNGPDATEQDVRTDLADLRRVLDACTNQLREVLETGDVAELIATGQARDDADLRVWVDQLRRKAREKFPDLAGEIDRLAEPVQRYCVQQTRLIQRCTADADVDRLARLRAVELNRVVERSTPQQLASLWDGIAFDAAPVWLDPASIYGAADEMTRTIEDEPVPEPGAASAAVEVISTAHRLRSLADELLAGRTGIDLTPWLLSLPWPRPAVAVAQLQLLTAIDRRYQLDVASPARHGDGTVPRQASRVSPVFLRFEGVGVDDRG
jgi:hypothetical protein